MDKLFTSRRETMRKGILSVIVGGLLFSQAVNADNHMQVADASTKATQPHKKAPNSKHHHKHGHKHHNKHHNKHHHKHNKKHKHNHQNKHQSQKNADSRMENYINNTAREHK